MSLYGFDTGFIVSAPPVLLAAGSNDVLAIAATADDVQVAEILIANADASARTVLVTKFDGSTAWTLIPTESIAANTRLPFTFPFVLPHGWTLRATPSVASQLTIHVTYIKSLHR